MDPFLVNPDPTNLKPTIAAVRVARQRCYRLFPIKKHQLIALLFFKKGVTLDSGHALSSWHADCMWAGLGKSILGIGKCISC